MVIKNVIYLQYNHVIIYYDWVLSLISYYNLKHSVRFLYLDFFFTGRRQGQI